MVRPTSKVSKDVRLSFWVFVLWWLLILGIHVVAGVYNLLYAYCYWFLTQTYLNRYLVTLNIGMPPPYHNTIAIVHAIMSVLHGFCILLMLGGSVWQRSLAFTPWASSRANVVDTDKENKEGTGTSSIVLQSFSKVYETMSDRSGFCGVNGKHFYTLLICRETVEIALQTVQAYRMSSLLPRALLNRFYLVLLVINCFASAGINFISFGGDEARTRLICILLDCVLDLVACMGVELIIVLSYVSDFDTNSLGFMDDLWRNDEWSARVLNELRMVLVVSWSDLVSRTIFSLGLIATTTNMKELLQQLPKSYNRVYVGNVISHDGGLGHKLRISGSSLIKQPKLPVVPSEHQASKQKNPIKKNHRLQHMMHLLVGLWGFLLLVLHIHASVQPTLPQCLLQVRPWAVSRPSCYLLVLDCHTLGISGRSEEVDEKWAEFDGSTVVQLLIRHCPVLEIPDTISEFHGVHAIKVYNSTIVDWGESAALTNANHPEVYVLYIARVNMTDGLLPLGFQAVDFPQNLRDLEFCVTNLRALPDDLDSKWHLHAQIQLEYSQLTTVLPVILRLEPEFLALSGNAIVEVPSELFQIPSLRTLGLSDTKLQELPRNVTSLSPTLNTIFIDETNISFFWPWAEECLNDSRLLFWSAPATSYCNSVEKILSGMESTFPVSSPEYSSILMDPSEENLQVVLYYVWCEGITGPYYSIGDDDANMALSTPTPLQNL